MNRLEDRSDVQASITEAKIALDIARLSGDKLRIDLAEATLDYCLSRLSHVTKEQAE